MSILTAEEVLEIAVRIEENGLTFYRSVAGGLKNEREKTLFDFLADEEQKHAGVFKSMLGASGSAGPKARPNYPDEYAVYLRAYAETLIFTEGSLKKEIEKILNMKAALDFGIRRELDSILYYQEMKPFVPKDGAGLLDEIIGEERKHFIKLSEMKKSL